MHNRPTDLFDGSPQPWYERFASLCESFLALLFTLAALLGIVGMAVLMGRWFPPVP